MTINFTISHNHTDKILESDWLPERSIFNQIQELDQIRSPITKYPITSAVYLVPSGDAVLLFIEKKKNVQINRKQSKQSSLCRNVSLDFV